MATLGLLTQDDTSGATKASGGQNDVFVQNGSTTLVSVVTSNVFAGMYIGPLAANGTSSSPGGGANNTADLSDPNNAYLVGGSTA